MVVVRPLYRPLPYNVKFEKVDGGYIDLAGPNIFALVFIDLFLCGTQALIRFINLFSTTPQDNASRLQHAHLLELLPGQLKYGYEG